MDKENFDILAKQALSEEDYEFMNNLDEQNISEMLMSLYKGKLKWLSVFIMIFIFIAFGFAVFCTVRFFQVETLREMMIYGAGGFVGLLMTAMLKFWFWMQMHNQIVLREIKRIELEMSIIALNLKN